MNILERDLEDIIFNAVKNGDSIELAERGLTIDQLLKYKLSICRQLKIGNYGVSDLILFNRINFNDCGSVLEITVIELKKDKIGIDSLCQLSRYIKGVKNFLTKHKSGISFIVRGVLIGKDVDLSTDFTHLASMIEDVSFFCYEYNYDGIYFSEKNMDDYELKDEGF